jgi:hypothetical protein
MNTSATTLLRALSTVGVRSIRFRLLSQNDVSKHTTPVAVLDEAEGPGQRMPRFSVAELFSAYSLVPRKGEYTLEVEHGQLSYTPPKARQSAKSEEVQEESAPKNRWKPKIAQRRAHPKSSRLRKFPSA